MGRRAALVLSEELYRAVVETCPDGIVVADLDGTIIAANTAAAQLHGFERGDELVGANLFQAVSLDDRDQMEKTIGDVLKLGQVRHVEHRLLRCDGTFPADVNISAVRDENGMPLVVVAVVRDMTEQRRLEEDLRHQALHDSLTGLANRVLLYDRLEHALGVASRAGVPVALLLLDLDGFKVVNDRFGHDFGDALLEEVAGRLRSVARESDTVARLGGDEFAIVVPEDVNGALQVAGRVREALVPLVTINQTVVSIGVSIGIARFPEDGQDRATLFRLADTAMYAAKRDRTGCTVYSPDLGSMLGRF